MHERKKCQNKTRRFFLLRSQHIIREIKCEVLESLLHLIPLTQPKLQLTVMGTTPEERLKTKTYSLLHKTTT